MATVVNIISGKGGTGKTLLCATLADLLGSQGASVLVVDLDIFVRGLTALLYFQRGESLRLTDEGEATVADLFLQRHKLEPKRPVQVGIQRYRSFDVLPCVTRIDEILYHNDIAPDDADEAAHILHILLSSLPGQYDFVFLDSRAGYDELIAATHELADFSICVQEEDPISNVTASNLVRQLERQSRKPVLRVVNKAQRVQTSGDYEGDVGHSVSLVGVIPFDMDVMRSFGERTFWADIGRSLYVAGVVRVWNRMARMLRLGHELPAARMSPFGSDRAEARLGFLVLRERVPVAMGLTLGLVGILYAVLGGGLVDTLKAEPSRALALYVALAGFALALLPLRRRR